MLPHPSFGRSIHVGPAATRAVRGRRTLRFVAALGFVAGALVAFSPATPAAPIPGYRLAAEWPASAHGLAAPGNLAAAPDGRLWLIDGPAAKAVALLPDGTRSEERAVPTDALDLAVGDDASLYLGRYNPLPGKNQPMSSAGRLGPDGAEVWMRRCDCATGSGVAASPGRIWLTEPAKKALHWLGNVDGRVEGQLIPRAAQTGFPADVTASPDGTLFATDLMGGTVFAWPPPYLPNDYQTWSMLEASGPFRIGAGLQSDGQVVVAILFSDGLVRVHRPDGTLLARFFAAGDPADIAVGKEGVIYILDERTHNVRVYEPGTPPAPTPVPPEPPRGHGACQIRAERTVDPGYVTRCSNAVVTLRLSATCPPDAVSGADVAVIIDTSLSMIAENKMVSAKAAALRFLSGLDLGHHKASVVAFSDVARLVQPLTSDRALLEAAIDGLQPDGSGTNIADALATAMQHITSAGRADALPVVVLLTDGAPNRPYVPEPNTAALAQAERARARRAYVITIGLGRFIDSLLMENIASSRADFFYSPNTIDLDRIYTTILRVVQSIGVTDLVVEDVPAAPFVHYAPGPNGDPPLVVGDRLQWTRPLLPADGLVLTWTLKAELPGKAGIGRARVVYSDADGTRRTAAFPEPVLESVRGAATPAPGVGPTAQPGPAPTATLPIAPPSASCGRSDAWRLAIDVFPDAVGYGGYACPGCNGIWQAGDRWEHDAWQQPGAVVVTDGGGAPLWVGAVKAAPTSPGQAYIVLCTPPPWHVRLAQVPLGYVSCPNSPPDRLITSADVGADHYVRVGFTLWSGCGRPTPAPEATAELEACP
ncbi:MAG: VWA domain-containing protein [Ardenticatenales bacterium]